MNSLNDLLSVICDVLVIVLGLWLLSCLIYFIIVAMMKFFKRKSRSALQKENEELKQQCGALESNILQLSTENRRLMSAIGHGGTQANNIIMLGSVKVKCANISYINTQSSEELKHPNPRVKVIHYVDFSKEDSVYSSFNSILQQLPDYFMRINKNQIINLKEVYKIQGGELFLKNVKTPFLISDLKQEELEQRLVQLSH